MKTNFLKLIALITLISTSLISGYAIVHNSASELPMVDIYVYKASSEQDAENKHKDYAKKLGYPAKVVNAFDKVRGFTKPIAQGLDKPTSGWSVVIQQGVDLGVDGLKKINELLADQIKEAVARLYRGSDHAYHKDVPRGNEGRFAEWKNGNTMYAIVTLPGSAVPLHATPEYIAPNGLLGFTVKSEPDKQDPKKKLYKLQFSPYWAEEYEPAELDKRDRNLIREAAKKSGKAAIALPATK